MGWTRRPRKRRLKWLMFRSAPVNPAVRRLARTAWQCSHDNRESVSITECRIAGKAGYSAGFQKELDGLFAGIQRRVQDGASGSGSARDRDRARSGFRPNASCILGCVPLPMGNGLDHIVTTANASNTV